MVAFQSSDPEAIEALLCEDATLEMVPPRTWFSGEARCAPYIRTYALASPGDWRVVPIRADGQPGVVAWLRDAGGAYRILGVAVLWLRPAGIARIVVFGGEAFAKRFTA